MLKIWGRRSSINVQKVLWLVGELNMPYEHIPIGGSLGGLDDPHFLAKNPHGHIPVIEDGDRVLWESHTILRYLAARSPISGFWSTDPWARSRVDRWMDWSQTALQPDFITGVFWGFYRTPDSLRNWPAIEESIRNCDRHMSLLNDWLGEQAYICGDNISLADIAIGTLLYRYFLVEVPRPPLPKVERWYSRLCNREPYQKGVMIPFEELHGRLDF